MRYSKIRAITRVASPATEAALLDHEHGYRVVTGSHGSPPRFVRRDGKPVPLADGSLRTSLGSDALAELCAPHAARGLAIDATTAFPRWDGTPLDAHLAVQALLTATGGGAAHDS